TLGCARCHNHKYGPFTQKEFYQTFAYFNNVPELGRAMKYGNSPPLVPAPTREQQAALSDIESKIRDTDKQIPPSVEFNAGDTRHGHWGPTVGLQKIDSPKQVGAVSFVPGPTGDAAVFDGKSYLDADKTGDFDIEDRFSISAWVYSDGVPDGAVVTKMAD